MLDAYTDSSITRGKTDPVGVSRLEIAGIASAATYIRVGSEAGKYLTLTASDPNDFDVELERTDFETFLLALIPSAIRVEIDWDAMTFVFYGDVTPDWDAAENVALESGVVTLVGVPAGPIDYVYDDDTAGVGTVTLTVGSFKSYEPIVTSTLPRSDNSYEADGTDRSKASYVAPPPHSPNYAVAGRNPYKNNGMVGQDFFKN